MPYSKLHHLKRLTILFNYPKVFFLSVTLSTFITFKKGGFYAASFLFKHNETAPVTIVFIQLMRK